MLCMLDTIAANRGGCALGRVCKRESQTLARRSDLRAMQAQPGFHEIMPGCLCVCACVCACVCMCVCACVCMCVCMCACVCMCVCVSHEASSRCPLATAMKALGAGCGAWATQISRKWCLHGPQLDAVLDAVLVGPQLGAGRSQP